MRSPVDTLGARDIQRAREEGRAAGAADRSRDDNPYRRPDRLAAWLQGWHQGQREREAPAPGVIVERATHPVLDRLRQSLAADRAEFAAGWHRDRHGEACWFDRPGDSLCRRRRLDCFWRPAADAPHCERCIGELALRKQVLPTLDPERRAEIERELRRLLEG